VTNFIDPKVASWFESHTFQGDPPSAEALLASKRRAGTTVGVCLPALDEQETVGDICAVITSDLVEPGVVDQLVVIDSGSRDETAARATEGGATVFKASELVPAAPSLEKPGKGESLWKSLAVVETDVIVWVDSDTRNFTPTFVTALVGPLLHDPDLVFTKAFYDRPLHGADGVLSMAGARVTEIGIRPLINLLYPELAGFIQPLSGEYGGRRDALLELPFATGYDVDLLMLIELVERHGLSSLAQVDLSNRLHRNRDVSALGRMSFEIMRTLLGRLDESGRVKLSDELPEMLTQFTDQQGSRELRTYDVRSQMRPPMRRYIDS
jgi:glucosyl-3-phosphoglycerate synthase